MSLDMMGKKIILEGVVGSKAYGLDTPESDTDIKGIFMYPIDDMLSLTRGNDTVNRHNPDIEYHEIKKYIRLALKSNPTILELLYLEDYLKLTKEGEMLIDIRDSFLSKDIFNSYGNYALNQAKKLYKLYKSGKEHVRHKKHARHCFKLLHQGGELLKTGSLTVRLDDPDMFFNIGEMEINDLMKTFSQKYDEFKNINTDIQDEPDIQKVNDLLLKIRRMY